MLALGVAKRMTKTELLELIANGENSGIAFKLDDIRAEQLAREVVALANFNGGRILLGDGHSFWAQGASSDSALLRRSAIRRRAPCRRYHVDPRDS